MRQFLQNAIQLQLFKQVSITCGSWSPVVFFLTILSPLLWLCLQFIDGRLDLLNSGGFNYSFEKEINMGEYAGVLPAVSVQWLEFGLENGWDSL